MTRAGPTHDMLEVDGHEIRLSNPDKVLFPDVGVTKRDLVDHYLTCAPLMLPYVADRPVTLRRYPDGIGGEHWFEKHAPDHLPEWVQRMSLPSGDDHVIHIVIQSAATLAALANLAAIELHVGHVRASAPDRVTELVLDLDPPDGAAPARVRAATRRVRDLLDALEVANRCKSSGSRGFHVHVPLAAGATPELAGDVARGLAGILAQRHPTELTTEHRKAKRGDRVLIDWFRNSPAQTSIAPYSPRARPGGPVATPMGWDELAGTDPRRWTIRSLPRRLAQKADPWDDDAMAADLPALGHRIAALLRRDAR